MNWLASSAFMTETYLIKAFITVVKTCCMYCAVRSA